MTMTENAKNARTETRELSRAMRISRKIDGDSIERDLWTITLSTGKTVDLPATLAAAVRLEELGFRIVATPSAGQREIRAAWDAAGIGAN